MQRSELLVSICIPTYNQPEAVKTLLHSILTQYRSSIEIVIRDDSEGDKTREIVSEFQHSLPIRYFRGRRRGLDDALVFLTGEARGKYIWWIGDDVLVSSAIKSVLSTIEKRPSISFLWVNSQDITLQERLTVRDSRSRYFRDRNEILSIDIGLLGFITATIIRRDIAVTALEPARKYIGTAFVCLYIVLYVICRGEGHYFLGKPCFMSHPKPPGEVRWYNQGVVFGINLYKVAIEFRDYFDRKTLRNALARNLVMVMKAIVVERGMGLNSGFAGDVPSLFSFGRIYWRYLEFYGYLPLLLLPRAMVRILYRLFKAFSRIRSSMVSRNG